MIKVDVLNNGKVKISVDVPKYYGGMEPGILDIQTYKTYVNPELTLNEQWFACVELIVEENGKLIVVNFRSRRTATAVPLKGRPIHR